MWRGECQENSQGFQLVELETDDIPVERGGVARSTAEGEPRPGFQCAEPECLGQWRARTEGTGDMHPGPA